MLLALPGSSPPFPPFTISANFQKIAPSKSQTASTAYFLQQMQYQASKTLAYGLLQKHRPHTIPYVIHTATCSTHTTILLAHPVTPSTGLHATTWCYQGCLTLVVVPHTFLPGLHPTKQHSSNAIRGTNRTSFTTITTTLPSTQTSTQLV